MQFEISPTILSPVLATMAKLIGSKPLLPILGHVKFYEHDGHYLLTATSGDQETIYTVELPFANVNGFHPFLASVAELTSMVKAAEGSIFPLTFMTGGKANDHQLTLDYGEGAYELMYADCAEYPVVKTGDEQGSITLPASAIAKLSQAIVFTSDDEMRPVMTQVLLDVRTTDRTRVVATDSKTLFLGYLTDVTASADMQLLISPRTIGLIAQAAPKDATIQISKTEKYIVITILAPTADGGTRQVCRIESRMAEGRYPRYEAVIPKNNTNVIDVECSEFLKAIERASVCANTATNQLRFDIAPGSQTVTVTAQDIDFSRQARTAFVPREQHVDAAMSIGFRANYLTRCIRGVGTTDLTFTFSDPHKACLLNASDQQTTILIMPVALAE